MAITEIKIDTIEPFAGQQSFGAAGPYIRVKGVAKGEIDPVSPENYVIADLDKASRNALGWSSMRPTFLSCGRQTRIRRAVSWSTT